MRASLRAALPPLVLGGPTASGKSALAADLAAAVGGAVVSADSRQAYRGMAVGSAQPGPGILCRAPHHLIGFLSPRAAYGAGEYGADARRVLAALSARGIPAVLCGGTGFWLRAAVRGVPPEGTARPPLAVRRRRRAALAARWSREGPEACHAELARVDPALAVRVHPRDRQRVLRGLEHHAERDGPLSASWRPAAPALPDAVLVRLELAPAELDRRITRRLETMLSAGLVDEARALRARYGDAPPAALSALGYQELFAALRGERSLDDALEAVRLRTRRYAKRQRTWFRRQDGYEPVAADERALPRILARWAAALEASPTGALRGGAGSTGAPGAVTGVPVSSTSAGAAA